MILISSAAYVNAEFQIEFGKLPPALLPVGNRRLYEYQIATMRELFPDEQICLSLPESYALSHKDSVFLERQRITILRGEENLSLGDSIAHAIRVAQCDDKIRLLHGDTWIRTPPLQSDCIGIVETDEDYAWEVEDTDARSESVWCGYFAFSDVKLFEAALVESAGDFAAAVKLYDTRRRLHRIWVSGWHDFGHVNTYFQSRGKLTTERAFNQLSILDGCVRKTGLPYKKILAEQEWFRKLPVSLRVYAPQVVDHGVGQGGQPYYVLEYLPLPPLNEVYVHGKNPVFYWNKLFTLCSEFLTKCSQQFVPPVERAAIPAAAVEMARDKTWNRLDEYVLSSGHPGLDVPSKINGIDVPSLRGIVNNCVSLVLEGDPVPGILHGDFCLSNILFDSRSDRIKVIDPRGLDANGELCIFGDIRYDLAKLTHSIVGLYDFIIAGAFDISFKFLAEKCEFDLNIHIDDRIRSIQEVYLNQRFIGDIKPRDVLPMTVLLFLSMLPLHSEKPQRQTALLANALRLYSEFSTSKRMI